MVEVAGDMGNNGQCHGEVSRLLPSFGGRIPFSRSFVLLIRHLTAAGPRDLNVSVHDPDATVADLASALAPDHPPGPLWFNGREVGPANPLDRLRVLHGCVVGHGPSQERGADGGVELLFTVGHETGRIESLAPGRHLVGRDGSRCAVVVDDRTVSGAHLWIEVAGGSPATVVVHDAGSTNGTFVEGAALVGARAISGDDSVQIGSTSFRVRSPSHDGSGGVPLGGGPSTPTIARHRTGRRDSLPPVQPIELPEPEPPAAAVTPIGLIALVVSLVGAGVMVAVLGSWTYAAFAVLGPVMMLANVADSRRRRRSGKRSYARRLRRDLERLDGLLTTAAMSERAHRRARFIGVHGAVELIASSHPSCWERRRWDPDAFEVQVGFGSTRWEPPTTGDLGSAAPVVTATLEEHSTLGDVAVGIGVRAGRCVAVVGPAHRARALARAMVIQMAALHGPADVAIAALTSTDTAQDWNWLRWLPHTLDTSGERLLADDPTTAATLAARLEATRGGGSEPPTTTTRSPLMWVIVDAASTLCERRSPSRSILKLAEREAADLACLVVLPSDALVPAECSLVIRFTDEALLDISGELGGPSATTCCTACCTTVEIASDLARRLACFEDPALEDDGRGLPSQVRLTALSEIDLRDPTALSMHWSLAGSDPSPTAVIGECSEGPLRIDLATDGPHLLIAGTTGSGKSELLRTLILGLAATNSPDHLTFALIDFKGGSAFDACSRLPHTTGLVTDLDEHLAARALRCLEAELRYRERRLREAGVADLSGLRAIDPDGDPLPRLVVVVDEFATLASALGEFVDSLVDVAQRGRSLGVHLVLATQRPSGSVSAAIRSNVSLRVALRVQSSQDSIDVIESPAAATLARLVPGRALVRLGPAELVTTQTACTSLPVMGALPPVTLEPLAISATTAHQRLSPSGGGAHPSDIDEIVDAMSHAWAERGRPAPRSPWPEPLPHVLTWDVTVDHSPEPSDEHPNTPLNRLLIGRADDPDHQRVRGHHWSLDQGPLLGVGLPGCGTTTLAGSVVLRAAARWSSRECHIHVIDAGPGALLPLAGLDQVGAVVTVEETERQRRLVEDLVAALAERRSGQRRAADPRRLLVVHGITTLLARWEEAGLTALATGLFELVTAGTESGIHVCVTAETASVPHRLIAACEQRVIFRLGDPGDHAPFAIPAREVPRLPPERGLSPVTGSAPLVVQIARPARGLAAAVAELAHRGVSDPRDGSGARPCAVGVLPDLVTLEAVLKTSDKSRGASDCSGAADAARGTLRLPFAIADDRLLVGELVLPPGAHALVSGPVRSGRTSLLNTLAASALSHFVNSQDALVVLVTATAPAEGHGPAGQPSPASRSPGRHGRGCVEVVHPDSEQLATTIAMHEGPLLLLVDDGDLTADDHPILAGVASSRRPGRHLVVSARNDRLRNHYGHWTKEIRADGIAVLLDPDLDLDGDLVGVRLPRRPSVPMVVGRGWLTGEGAGANGWVQTALIGTQGTTTP